MLTDFWPLFGLRINTPRLELRLATDDELADLAQVAADGVHEADRMPFLTPWTDGTPEERARAVLQFQWRQRAGWQPDHWGLPFTVFHEGRPLGVQEISARDFAVRREVATGSWLGLRHQGRGFGTEMRAAALELAFVGLAAEECVSAAFEDSHASREVSRRLGYRDDGVARKTRRGRVVVEHRLRLTRERWSAHRRTAASVTGLEPCLPMFGR
ncbi:GNAT family N-acetyltransferase [Streptomyces bohaiensis]|uniref:GNAT family N-acetyltransferase n=1 Tax=Streptomyces bohaiensis TaxID=1431344 RepID=UPI003B7C1721